MFGKLGLEMHKREVNRDHNKLIAEAADDIIEMDESEDNISLEDLDDVMNNDGDTVTQEEVDQLENLVGEVANKDDKDVTKMTKDEIEKQIHGIETPSLPDLNS